MGSNTKKIRNKHTSSTHATAQYPTIQGPGPMTASEDKIDT